MSKLYTEEQVIAGFTVFGGVTQDHAKKVVELLTPIQLPTDEDVEQYLNSFPYTKHLDDGQYNDGVIVGAELAIEWMRDKIKGGQGE